MVIFTMCIGEIYDVKVAFCACFDSDGDFCDVNFTGTRQRKGGNIARLIDC